MNQSQIERSYHVVPHALFGACLTALAHMHAQIKEHDAERGTIAALVSGGPLAAATELGLRVLGDGSRQARLVVNGRPNRRGDQLVAARFLQLVDQLLSQA